jgi:hypothetical protein
VHLGAVDGDQLDPHQAGVGAQPQHIGEQIGQRPLVADSEARSSRDPAPDWRRSRETRRP